MANMTIEGEATRHVCHRIATELELIVDFQEKPKSLAQVPRALTNVLSKLTIFKMQEKLGTDLASNNIGVATQRLESMATRLLSLGETDLARSMLLEAGQLARSGSLSAESRKMIRYGTRALPASDQETKHD